VIHISQRRIMMDSKSSAGEEREVLKVFAYIPNIIGNSIDCKMR